MNSTLKMAPNTIRIYYRTVDGNHRFTSPDLPGLLIYHSDLAKAVEILSPTISLLVEATTGEKTEYELMCPEPELIKMIEMGTLSVSLNKSSN